MAQIRKDSLINGEVYHIYTRSIAKFVIFNDDFENDRIIKLMNYYRYQDFRHKFSQFHGFSKQFQNSLIDKLKKQNELLVDIIAFCIMPTHIHLILKQVADDGISKYMARVLNGYSRYFNTKHQRLGPLWSGRFKSVLINDDDQLLHLTRYIHLNPTSAGLVKKPEEWKYSSYLEYIGEELGVCNCHDLIVINPEQYKNFVNDRIDYQKQLSMIKYLTIDDYSG